MIISSTGLTTSASLLDWDFSDIPGLNIYLRGSSVVNVAGKAEEWNDLSGEDSHFVQNTALIRPNFIALDADYPIPQPAVKFDVGDNRLVCSGSPANIRWMAAIATYPNAAFSDYATLIGNGAGNEFPFRGEHSQVNWRTSDGLGGFSNRFRNGVDTDVAITTANTPHFYECFMDGPSPYTPTSALWLGGNFGFTGRIWYGSCCLILSSTVTPTTLTRSLIMNKARVLGMLP